MFAPFSTKSKFFLTRGGKILFFLILLFAIVRAERLPVRVFTSVDGLGSSAIDSLLHDSRGFLWFATRDGLSRFDGFKFTNYRFGADSAASISNIIERRNGDYLVLDTREDVYRFNAATTVSEAGADGSLRLNAEKVYEKLPCKLLEDREGVLWCGGANGLSRVSEANGKLVIEPPLEISLPAGKFDALIYYVEDDAQTFWITTSGGLVRIDKNGRVLAFYTTPPPSAMQTFLIYLFRDLRDRIWIEAQGGFYVLKPEAVDLSKPFEPRPLVENIKGRLPENPSEIVRFTASDGLTGRVVPALLETSDGRVWLAGDNGLVVYDGKEFRHFSAENGLGEYLSGIAEDGDGNIWLSSLSGAYKLARDGLTTFTRSDGLGRSDITAIYQSRTSEIFVAQGDWFVSRFHYKEIVTAQPALGENRGVPLWTSNASFLDSRGSWWFLTQNKLLRYDNAKRIEDLPQMKPSEIFETGEIFRHGAFYRMFEDSRQNVWISTRSANPEKMGLAVWRRSENKFYTFGKAENFPSGRSPSAFCEDLQGNFWIGFYNGGLGHFKDGKFTLFAESESLSKNFVTALMLDRAGKLWIATAGGVYVVDETAAETPAFRKIEGVSSSNARALAEDDFGRIYVGTVRGIDRISPDTNQVRHFSTADGLADDFVTTAFRDQNGAMWFGTRSGLSKFVPAEDKPLREPPILIAALRIAGEKQPVPELGAAQVENLDLGYAQNNLQIDFFSLGFASPERIRYQFKLEGADTDWSAPSAERTVNYSNLAAGDYRFLVRAVNPQGLMSANPATISFRIAPPFWKTWWFSALAILIAVGAIYYLLNQRFKRRLELEKVRTRIATDLHDDIGASLSRISMLSEIVKQQDAETNPKSAKHLTQIAADARGLVDSMSDIVWAINPRRDSIESVVDRVCSFAADTLGTRNVHWTVETPAELKHLHLTAEQKRNLYLIFKEAVNNAARHSGCQNASLKIRIERGCLIAEIADDGKGFSAENKTNGNSLGGRGLENMRSRAVEIGGALRSEANEPAGTKIILTLPIGAYRINGWFPKRRK